MNSFSLFQHAALVRYSFVCDNISDTSQSQTTIHSSANHSAAPSVITGTLQLNADASEQCNIQRARHNLTSAFP